MEKFKIHKTYAPYERLILNSACNIGYEEEPYYNELETDLDKLKFIYGRFLSEFKVRPTQENFKDWLQGMALNLPYMYTHIEAWAIEKGELKHDSTDAQVSNYLQNWWSVLGMRLGTMVTRAKLEKRS